MLLSKLHVVDITLSKTAKNCNFWYTKKCEYWF